MLTVTFVALLALQPPDDARLTPEIAWAGVIPDESLRKAAPESGAIGDSDAFKALWDAWRSGEQTPEIDFTKTIIVVGTIDGPNRMFVSLKNEAGNLQTQFGGTKVGGPGFGYIIAAVKREGIDRVNGQPLAQDASEPTPAPTRPQRPRPRPTPPEADPQPRPAPRGNESIRVVVRGRLETDIVAIGGETTGVVIRSKGLMFEVALDRPELKERAEALNGQHALVAGELVVKEGVETGTRLIIEADRIDLVRVPRR